MVFHKKQYKVQSAKKNGAEMPHDKKNTKEKTMYKKNSIAEETASMIDNFLRNTGMTQSEFSKGCGVNLATINRVLKLRITSINYKNFFKIKKFIEEYRK